MLAGVALAGCSGSSTPSSPTQSTPGTPTAGAGDATPPASTPSAEDTEGLPPAATATPTEPGDQSPVLLTLPGSADGSCVDSSNDGQLRSGGFAAGDFDLARKEFSGTLPGTDPKINLFFVPLHAEQMPGVTIRGEGPGDAKLDVTSTTTSLLDTWKFYPVELTIATPGRWEIQVESGPDRGCFAVDLAR